MSIKTFKPTTPSRRHMTVSGFDGIDKHAKPEASLTEVLKKNAGRNSYGRITVRHRGGGEKRKYRIIDFKRDKVDMEATVLRLEYDPNRSANIALVQYEDGEKRYILHPKGLKVGDMVMSGSEADINKYVAEIRFFRAQDYYSKIRNFGDVPWYESDLQTGDEAELFKGRDPRNFVLKKIIEDLEFAIQWLPEKTMAEKASFWIS